MFLTFYLFVSVADEKDGKVNVNVEKSPVFFSGNVADKITGEALAGVEIRIEGISKKVYTDFDGNFSFDDVSPGEYSISANYISYQNKKIEKIDINFVNNYVDVKLEPQN